MLHFQHSVLFLKSVKIVLKKVNRGKNQKPFYTLVPVKPKHLLK